MRRFSGRTATRRSSSSIETPTRPASSSLLKSRIMTPVEPFRSVARSRLRIKTCAPAGAIGSMPLWLIILAQAKVNC